MSSLTAIAERALAQAKKLDAYSQSRGLPPTHFFYDTLGDLPKELEENRRELVNASQDLKRLALGPVGMMLETLFTVSKCNQWWDSQATELTAPPHTTVHRPAVSALRLHSQRARTRAH